jgi:hypothetical protein
LGTLIKMPDSTCAIEVNGKAKVRSNIIQLAPVRPECAPLARGLRSSTQA